MRLADNMIKHVQEIQNGSILLPSLSFTSLRDCAAHHQPVLCTPRVAVRLQRVRTPPPPHRSEDGAGRSARASVALEAN